MSDNDIEDILDTIEYTGVSRWKNLSPEERNRLIKLLTDEDDNLDELNEYRDETIYSAKTEIALYNNNTSNYFDLLTSEIPLVLSTREFIESTHEYMYELKKLVTLLENNTIDVYMFCKKRIHITRNLRSKLYYHTHKSKISKLRQRNKLIGKSSKSVSRRVVQKYKTHIIAPKFINQRPVITPKGILYYPSADQLIQLGTKICAGIHHKHGSELDLSVMCSLQISGATDLHVIASSNKVRILDFDSTPLDKTKIERELEEAATSIANTADGYSFVDNIAVRSVFITVTAFKFCSIHNWFEKMQLTSDPYWNIAGAKIYLAFNQKGDDCKKLCVEHFGGIWDDTKSLEEMLPNKKILYYYPRTGNIRDVSSINDLVSTVDTEFITSNNCVDVVRLIKANGHMAVIDSMNFISRPSTRKQTRRALNHETNECIEIFFDIEAYQDRTSTESTSVYYQKPYLLCWSDTTSTDVYTITGSDCCSIFVETLLKTYSDCTIILYAWYGSGYDYHHTLKYLLLKNTSSTYVLKNTSIMSATIYYENINLTIILKDPFLFLLTSLHKASKAFNVTNKSEFPHDAISSENDLNTVLNNWYTVKESIIESYPEYSNTNLLVKKKQYRIYETSKNTNTILEKAIEYCKIDVIAMKEIWLKFQHLLVSTFSLCINKHTFTLSQLSMKLLEANLPENVSLTVPDLDDYLFLRQAIYGGRVIAQNNHYKEEILYADVVSLYPSAMKLLEHAYGTPIRTTSINWNRHGIYKVTLTHALDSEPTNYTPFVPRRDASGKLSWCWFKETTGVYHTYDLLIAKDLGYNIHCIHGIEYAKKGYILNDFVTKLFDLKNIHSNCNCSEQPCPIRMIAKIALNGGGYGKFVQKPVLKSVFVVERDIVAAQYDSIPRTESNKILVGGKEINPPTFYNLDGNDFDKMIIEVDDKPYYSTQTGISILSASRYRLYTLCKQFTGMQVVYSDTDSIFVKANSVDKSAFNSFCGIDLGQLDNKIDGSLNNTIHEMIVLGPKMYAYKYLSSSGQEKITFHSKGVPTKMLSWSQFEHLAKSKQNNAYYEFDTLTKRITAVMTRQINKQIRQT